VKKSYEKPILAKTGDLPLVTAQRYPISGHYCIPGEQQLCDLELPDLSKD